MKPITQRVIWAGSVFSVAIATGFVMQNGDQIATMLVGSDEETIVEGSSAYDLDVLPQSNAPPEKPQAIFLPEFASTYQVAAFDDLDLPQDSLPAHRSVPTVAAPDADIALPKIENPVPTAVKLPADPVAEALEAPVVETTASVATTTNDVKDIVADQNRFSAFGLPCSIEWVSKPGLGGQVDLSLRAPCYANAPVVISHSVLRFTDATDQKGNLNVSVPALAENAEFEIKFDTGSVATTQIELPVANLMSHVALQWQGDAGLQIHAFEYGSSYGEDGHVHLDAAYSPHRAERLAGGYMTALGKAYLPAAWMAEVYTFPVSAMATDGVVRINVETEVSKSTCGRELAAETIQPDGLGGYSVVDLTVSVPDCSAEGEFLVLKNVIRDMKVALN